MRILVVEDEADLRRQLADALTHAGYAVDLAADGEDGHFLGSTEDYDACILDLGLPEIDGLSVLGMWRKEGRDFPVLVLTARDSWSDKVAGLDAGADDYLAKPFQTEELIARLRALYRRSSGREHSAVILYGEFECHVKARTAFRQNQHIALSPKEFELFRYFMENAGEIVTREMLLRDVWKMDFDPQTNVVDVNIGRLRRKLEEGFDKPALETIWGSGYRILDGQ